MLSSLSVTYLGANKRGKFALIAAPRLCSSGVRCSDIQDREERFTGQLHGGHELVR